MLENKMDDSQTQIFDPSKQAFEEQQDLSSVSPIIFYREVGINETSKIYTSI